MNKISILGIILVSILLVMSILSAYLARRVFKLKKTVELLRIDRNDLLEERAKQSNKLRLKGIEMDEENKNKFILSTPDKQLIIAALNMPEYEDTIADPKTSYQVRKIYRDLREKIKESLKD